MGFLLDPRICFRGGSLCSAQSRKNTSLSLCGDTWEGAMPKRWRILKVQCGNWVPGGLQHLGEGWRQPSLSSNMYWGEWPGELGCGESELSRSGGLWDVLCCAHFLHVNYLSSAWGEVWGWALTNFKPRKGSGKVPAHISTSAATEAYLATNAPPRRQHGQ